MQQKKNQKICKKSRFSSNFFMKFVEYWNVGESRQPWAIFQFLFFLGTSLAPLQIFFIWLLKKIYMYKVNLKIFSHLVQGTLFGGCLGPQLSTHFRIIKTKEMKDYSTQCRSNLWKNKKIVRFSNFPNLQNYQNSKNFELSKLSYMYFEHS